MPMGVGGDGTAGHSRVVVYAIGGNALSDPSKPSEGTGEGQELVLFTHF